MPADGHWAGQVIGPMVGAAVAAALVGVSKVAAHEAAERQRLVDQLRTAQDSLARAHIESGVRSERQRLAGEIHDTLAQGFTSILLTTRRARQAAVSGEHTRLRGELGDLETLSHEGIDQARRLVGQLPPAELENSPLPVALGLLADGRRPGGGPAVDVRIDGEPRPLGSGKELAILRVAQEALANARRHGRATHVIVTLTYHGDTVSLDVVDDGDGFAPGQAQQQGFGLIGMRNRIEQIGGRFAVETSTGHGTAVNAAVPA